MSEDFKLISRAVIKNVIYQIKICMYTLIIINGIILIFMNTNF